MQEMIEPDRTILIVSVVGLIVIWGSVAYHKWVQDSAPAVPEAAGETPADEPAAAEAPVTVEAPAAAQAPKGGGRRRKKGKGR